MRLIRLALDEIVLPDAVTGLTLLVNALAGVHGRQGSLFDVGFATASAAEASLSCVADDQRDAIVEPVVSAHPPASRSSP
jgi:hypothetical protein